MKAADEEFQVAVAAMKSAVDAFKRAKDSGDSAEAGRLKPGVAAANAEVQRLNTEFQRLAALRPDSTSGPYPARPGASSEAADPLDRLQKLADLHDRGVLTDAEFAAEKAKILSAG
jgi:Short C-terminal domain